MANITERIKELRLEKKLSQQQLADSTGIKRYTIANWEQGRIEPDTSYIILLAKFFEVSTDYLLGITEY